MTSANEVGGASEAEMLKVQVGVQIAAREAERQQRVKELRGDAVEEENVHGFFKEFTGKMTGLQETLASIEQSKEDGFEREELEKQLDGLKDEFQGVKDFANAGCLHLPPYDQRSMQLKLSAFAEESKLTRARIVPRQKFGFKKKDKKKGSVVAGTKVAEAGSRHSDAVEVHKESRTISKEEMSQYDPIRTLLNRKGETIILDKSQLAGGDVFIKECEDCVIYLCGSMGALRIEELKGCVVMTGPICGGMLIEGVVDCKFHIAAHQLRVHHTTQSDFYVRMRSTPIIEDCSGLRFAPCVLAYPGIEEEFETADMSEVACADLWSKVQDFKWLKVQQSPHWSIMPESERVAPVPPSK